MEESDQSRRTQHPETQIQPKINTETKQTQTNNKTPTKKRKQSNSPSVSKKSAIYYRLHIANERTK